MAPVKFLIQCTTQWGESCYVVGSAEAIGSWNTRNAVLLNAGDQYPLWQVIVDLPVGITCDYKYLISRGPNDKSPKWEQTSTNRQVTPVVGHIVTANGGKFGVMNKDLPLATPLTTPIPPSPTPNAPQSPIVQTPVSLPTTNVMPSFNNTSVAHSSTPSAAPTPTTTIAIIAHTPDMLTPAPSPAPTALTIAPTIAPVPTPSPPVAYVSPPTHSHQRIHPIAVPSHPACPHSHSSSPRQPNGVKSLAADVPVVTSPPAIMKVTVSQEESQLVNVLEVESLKRMSYEDKLHLVWSVIDTDPTVVTCTGHVALLSAFLQFLGSGYLRCTGKYSPGADSNHFNGVAGLVMPYALPSYDSPCDRSLALRLCMPYLSSRVRTVTTSSMFGILRYLSSSLEVPSEICTSLKVLLSQLHKAPSMQVLADAEDIQKRVQMSHVRPSESFISSLEALITELKEVVHCPALYARLAEVIDDDNMLHDSTPLRSLRSFLSSKTFCTVDSIEALRLVTAVRQALISYLKSDAAVDSSLKAKTLRVMLTDIKTEEHAVALLGQLAGTTGERPSSWRVELEVCALAARNLGMSGIRQHREVNALHNELVSLYPFTEFLEDNKQPHVLRLKAALERGLWVSEEAMMDVQRLYGARCEALGTALGVSADALAVAVEDMCRSMTVFNMRRLFRSLYKRVRLVCALPRWEPVVYGTAQGRLAHCETVSDLRMKINREHFLADRPIIALLSSASDTDALPDRVVGVVVAHDISLFSPFVCGAREKGIPLAVWESPALYRDFCGALSFVDGDALSLSVLSMDQRVPLLRTTNNRDSPMSLLTGIMTMTSTASGPNSRRKPTVNDTSSEVRLVLAPEVVALPEISQPTGGFKADTLRRLVSIAKASIGTPGEFAAPGYTWVVPYGVMELALKANADLHGPYREIMAQMEAPIIATDNSALTQLAAQLQALVERLTVPVTVTSSIAESFKGATRLIFRPSAMTDHSADVNLAGLYETVYNVSGSQAAIAQAVKRVWHSFWNAKAVLTRRDLKVKQSCAYMAVIVQAMAPADLCFHAFTANPSTGSSQEVYMEMAVGNGSVLRSAPSNGSPLLLVMPKKSRRTPSYVTLPSLMQQSGPSPPPLTNTMGAPMETEVLARSFPSYVYAQKPVDQPWEGAGTPPSGFTHIPIDYSAIPICTSDSVRQRVGRHLAAVAMFVEDRMNNGPIELEGCIMEDESISVLNVRPYRERLF